MKLEFVTNSSVLLRLADGATLLTDPWYSDGIYYGSWYNFPPLTDEQRARYLGSRPSGIYISHLHPDHLDPATLGRFPKDTPILIGRLPHDHLRRAVLSLGFQDVRELPLGEEVAFGEAKIAILPQFEGTGDGLADRVAYAIDSSLFVRDSDGSTLLHVVDNPIKERDAEHILARYGRPDVAILPYGGASFYPHAFKAFDASQKRAATERLKIGRAEHFTRIAKILGSRFSIPAAGSYVMGGRIAHYSDYLHQASSNELRAIWSAAGLPEDAMVVLAPGDALDPSQGLVEIDKSAHFRDFTPEERAAYARTLSSEPLPQDEVVIPSAFQVPWRRMLAKARRNLWHAQQRLRLSPAVDIELHIRSTPHVTTGSSDVLLFAFPLDAEQPHGPSAYRRAEGRDVVAFYLDASLLLMVMLCAAIWNNIEIAALVECERVPEKYNPTVHSLMSYFTL